MKVLRKVWSRDFHILLRSHEQILLCHLFSTTMHQLYEDEETDTGEKEILSIYIIKEGSSHPG